MMLVSWDAPHFEAWMACDDDPCASQSVVQLAWKGLELKLSP